MLENIEITSIRAADKAPFTKTNLSKKQIDKVNLGQDLPFLLNQTPSVVVNSDAGNGVGYTGIHIRGTDASRINVTLNGIPYNDAESQGTFFVDMPDISSSCKFDPNTAGSRHFLQWRRSFWRNDQSFYQ